jgi:NRPS condensation-like uncharacterized protein
VLKSTCDPVRGRYWRVQGDLDPKSVIVLHDLRGGEPGAAEGLVADWLAANVDVRREVPLKTLVLRRPDGDTVVVTHHHAAGDGRSMVIVLEALHDAYVRLAAEPGWVPEEDPTPRTLRWLLAHHPLGWFWTPALVVPRALWRQLALPPSGGWVPDPPRVSPRRRYISLDLPPGRVEALRRGAKAAGRTVNDFMLAAEGLAWRAMREEQGLPPANFTTGVLVDMRRGAGVEGRGVANFSSVELLMVPESGVLSADFAERIMDAAARVKRDKPGVRAVAPLLFLQVLVPSRWLTPRLESLWNRMARRKGVGCWLTNIGVLPDSLGDWGGVPLDDVLFYVAATGPPTLIGAVTTYRDRCHVAFGFAEGHLDGAQQRRLLELFREKLDEVAALCEGAPVRAPSRPAT